MGIGEDIRKCGYFASRGDGIVARVIAWITAPWYAWNHLDIVPNHCGMVFEDADGRGFYFESEYYSDERLDGWRGPIPLGRLKEWGRAPGRWVEVVWLDFSPEEAQAKWRECIDRLDEWTRYPLRQLLQMYLKIRFGRPVQKSERYAVCSEAVGRILQTLPVHNGN